MAQWVEEYEQQQQQLEVRQPEVQRIKANPSLSLSLSRGKRFVLRMATLEDLEGSSGEEEEVVFSSDTEVEEDSREERLRAYVSAIKPDRVEK